VTLYWALTAIGGYRIRLGRSARPSLPSEYFLWREHRGDHARGLALCSRGFTVLRFADTQIDEEPARVVADVARALAQEDWLSKR
jgi:Protein of unknown function (DUF559)